MGQMGLFKLKVDADTVNKVQSLLIPLDPKKGQGFRISRAWIQHNLDAIAAADRMVFNIATQKKAGLDVSDLPDINSEYNIFTKPYDFHLAEAAITNLEDPTVSLEIDGIDGVYLQCNENNYINFIAEGQAAAKDLFVCFYASYTDSGNPEYKDMEW